ncbi:bifunctional metallophosphatase/5'-nucleotidase [Dolosicoccus paucivorans]|uniref:bifunctional metallophosphatase/5'-nucleotidase n=1 Tax=Dolosicoccus paucivorans TaxID=84521 RepID=UPI00088589A7|nr:bifunctional UDP-sugar hydrolase/5'-nucleotidase [Dolosicoccus paucivorans]SDI87162.1 2',3'-cyclic-nucleotide 2'-phosphodiesterase / 3'-nucleotidase [Dolosicoccus paucivorans]
MSKKIHLFITSDTHANWSLNPPSLYQTSHVLKSLQKQHAQDEVITIDLGDFIQGTGFATYFSQIEEDGSVFSDAMNALNYDYQVIGNHEFNFGLSYLTETLSQLKSQILCSNILNKETKQPFMGKPYTIIEKNGLKMGLIGATTQYIPNWEPPQNYEGLVFKDMIEAVGSYIDELRPKVDLLVVAYHGGFEADLETFELTELDTGENQGSRLLKEYPEIDLLLTGHQHRVINTKVNDTYVIQPGRSGEYIGHITIDSLGNITSELVSTIDACMDEELMKELAPKAQKAQKWLNTSFGVAPILIPTEDEGIARAQGIPFIELINYIQLQETDADFSAAALINDGFKSFKGAITNEVLLQAYPFFNLIAKVAVTGQDLYDIMEYNYQYYQLDNENQLVVNPTYKEPKPKHYNRDLFSGLKTVVDMTKPQEQRIIQLIDESTNEPIQRDKLYTLAVSQYRASGGGNFNTFTPDKLLMITQQDIATLIPQYIQKMTQNEWDQINTHYQHVQWTPNVEFSKINDL